MQIPLAQLQAGKTGTIIRVESPELELILMNMGVCSGDTFTLSDMAPFGGPIAIAINGTKISLRKQDAARILIEAL